MRLKLQLYKPHEKQLEFHSSGARYRVASWGRQSGKSTACLNELVKRAWENPGTKYWFVSPTYQQARIQYRRLIGMLWSCPEVMVKKNQTELRVKLINNSEISFRSGENFDNLRGETLHGVVVDEVRDQHPELWPQVLRPMLTTTKGWAAFVSTPNGFDAFYDLAERSKTDPDWAFMSAPSTCNPLFTVEEYEAAKRELSDAEFAQEINAEFRDLHSGSVYVCFSDANLRTDTPFAREPGKLYSPFLPVLIGLDFNLSPMAWILGQERAGDFYFFDELFLRKSHTQEAALELIQRLKRMDLRLPTPVILIGDATGKAGQRAAAGKSDYAILCEMLEHAGIKYENRTPEANPAIKDRINVVNAKLKSATGSHHLWVNPVTCPNLKRDLQRVVWKPGATFTLDQSSNPELTHISDAMGYAVHGTSKMWEPSAGGLRVLRRQ
jgi:hypothetical protein